MGPYQWAEGICSECQISMVWLPGSYGQPDAEGRCTGCQSKLATEIGYSMDRMVSGCRLAHQVEELRAVLTGGRVSHSRSRYGLIHVYYYDASSPSGFRLAGSFSDRPEITDLLRGGLSPLSPTEAR